MTKSRKKSFQKQRLRGLLIENGWKIESADLGTEWWQDELWRIVSEWTPIGFEMQFTFVFDPDELKEVWCVRVSKDLLTSQHEDTCFEMSLMHSWEKGLPELIDYLDRSRTSAKV